MPRRAKGARVLGPYQYRGQWRVVLVRDDGERLERLAATEREAQNLIAKIEREIHVEHTPRTIQEATRTSSTCARRGISRTAAPPRCSI